VKKVSLLSRFAAPLLLLITICQLSFGQQTIGKETLGTDYFQQGNYEKALPIFAKLAQSYPDNAMYNYYYGVCLIKNDLFETAAKEALLNAVVDKTPANANFYLANYFHALQQWQEAKDFYDRYDKIATKQEKKLLRFDYFVGLCEKKSNPFTPKKGVDTSLFGDAMLKPPPKIDEKFFPIPDALKKSWFNFQVNEILAYHSIDDFKSEAGKILFTKAWMCTGKNDSLILLTDSLRKVHEGIARVETRLGLVQQIVDCEQKSYQLMREREKFLDQSRVKESAFWDKEGKKAALDYNSAIQERENKLNESKKKVEKPIGKIADAEIPKDTIRSETTKSPDSVPQQAPKQIQNEEQIFKVQLGSFKNGLLPPAFKKSYAKISKLRRIDKFTDEKKNVVYTVGSFVQFADASKMKDQLVAEGMKGAVVAPFDKNTGKPIKKVPVSVTKKDSVQTVLPQPALKDDPSIKSVAVENLIFKVQIGSFKNGILSPSFKKAYIRISKLQKVEKYTDSKKFDIYTVGNFALYPDAAKMKDQMVTEGIRDAFVAAFHNGVRIKVVDALKLAGGK
jgi:tetratricopeptide (TPR) repeat protein